MNGLDDFVIENIQSRQIKELRLHYSNQLSTEELSIYYVYDGEQYQSAKQVQATIWLYLKEKRFDFAVEYDSMLRGYGSAIYKAAPQILRKLNFNPDEWTMCAAHTPVEKSSFIEHINNNEKGDR